MNLKQVLGTLGLLLAATPGLQTSAQVVPGEPVKLQMKNTDWFFSTKTSQKDSNPVMQSENASGFNQNFIFEETPVGASAEGFNIKADGLYLYQTQWNLHLSSETSKLKDKNFIFDVEADGDYVQIKVRGNGKSIGKDDTGEGKEFYSDKGGSATAWFKVIPINPVGYYGKLLDNVIAEAQSLLDTTEEGSGEGQYPVEARTALQKAIADAKAAKEGGRH